MKKTLRVTEVVQKREVTAYTLSSYNFKGVTALGMKVEILEDSKAKEPLKLKVDEELSVLVGSGFTEFNFNNYVKFKLEDYGKSIWVAHYRDLAIIFKIPECDEEGFYKLQMWEYCQIFGSHMGAGFKNPTELNVLVQIK